MIGPAGYSEGRHLKSCIAPVSPCPGCVRHRKEVNSAVDYTPYSLLVDVGWISLLMVIGNLLRRKVGLFQRLLMPASITAGLLAPTEGTVTVLGTDPATARPRAVTNPSTFLAGRLAIPSPDRSDGGTDRGSSTVARPARSPAGGCMAEYEQAREAEVEAHRGRRGRRAGAKANAVSPDGPAG